jgi:hypothetical protein
MVRQDLRALMHFKLSQLFGKQFKQDPTGSLSVPVVLEPYEGNVQAARNTLKEVYTQLRMIYCFSKASITNTAKSRATVAAALLARGICIRAFYEAATAANAVVKWPSVYHSAANYTFYNNKFSIFKCKMLLEIMVLNSFQICIVQQLWR